MNNLLRFLAAMACFNLVQSASAQELLTLEDAIEFAKNNSTEAQSAKTTYENSTWTYKSYRANLLPSMQFTGTIPSFNRSFVTNLQDDGTQVFVPSNYVSTLGNIRVNQNIGLTGGSVFLSTGLTQQINQNANNPVSYLSTPIRVGFQQDLFGFNNFKWQNETQPLQFEKAKQQYLEQMEGVAISTVNLFFNYYDAQINVELAKLNFANSDTLYKISKGRYQLGKIAEHDLLQMELNLLNSKKNYRQALIDLENAEQELKNFIGIKSTGKLLLMVPNEIDTFSVQTDLAVQKALNNRSDVLDMQQRMIGADRELARAKSSARPNVSLNASYGISGNEATLTDAYGNTLPQQQFTTSVSVPILNWGRGKADVKIAESNKELTQVQVDMQKLSFEQEIKNQVNQFNFRKQEYYIAAKSDTIGQKRFEVAYKRYMIGKIDITDLNIAQQDKDQSKRNYLNTLRRYWIDYYRLRQLTLYDFEQNADIEF
ncbi:MAG: TolC family protein [Bacteroidetes bacterium]|nr:TolC family protein [Bacteroidota bacterium]